MPLEARPPKIRPELNFTTRNLLIVVMCVAFAAWFSYDGLQAWPEKNDQVVKWLRGQVESGQLDETSPLLQAWKGWNAESVANRTAMDEIVRTSRKHPEGWHDVFDIKLQRWISAALLVVLAGAIWRFVHYQQLRATADETMVSPKKGVTIPWEKITVVDNTNWPTYDLVELTYTDASGVTQQAQLDGYKLDREMLLPILELLATKAQHAEFLPKEEAAAPEAGTAKGDAEGSGEAKPPANG